MNTSFWKGRRVFITGHTGFKGGWLTLWLHSLGAEVSGYALPPQTNPNFYSVAQIASCLTHETLADIRNEAQLRQAIQAAQPEFIFHLAAQPLVRYSYAAPIETYAVNVMGTAHLLEAARHTTSVQTIINVTTDKCYENRERQAPYKEDEALGGHDPYSNSKACSELVTQAYRQSFFMQNGIGLASARAGNVIGGGDWSDDRLIPDFLKSIDAGLTLHIRHPNAIRPWQHVLEPLAGYITLAQALRTNLAHAQAWNFGPHDTDMQSVQWIVENLCARIPSAQWRLEQGAQLHEAQTLKLDSTKAMQTLNWHPKWHLESALEKTILWHQAWKQGESMLDFSLQQIHEYTQALHV